MNKTFRLFLPIVVLAISLIAKGQEFPCKNDSYAFLSKCIGKWTVQTKDRIAPGEYEENTGEASISTSINGCGIQISYRGKYKNKSYARESIITGLDSSNVQMVAMDSEHGGFLTYEGQISDQKLNIKWYRNKENGRLISKYELRFSDENQFEFSSYLSTDGGSSWALTHQRIFNKKSQHFEMNAFAVIVGDIEKSIQWYGDLLGFEVLNRSKLESKGIEIVNLKVGSNRLELIQIDSSIAKSEVLNQNQRIQGLFKVGMSVSSLEPYVSKMMMMDASFNEQVVVDPVSGRRMIVLKDPDSNRIQLFE